MAVSQYSGDTNYISLLPNKPVTDGGLTAAQFKAKFDQFGTEFKAWFNSTFITSLSNTFATKDAATTSDAGLMSASDKDKLDGIGTGANVSSVASKTGAVTLVASDISDLDSNQIRAITSGTYTAAAADWSSHENTVTVSGLLATDDIIVSPSATDYYTWRDDGIYCKSQSAGSVTLGCETDPSADITFNILVVS